MNSRGTSVLGLVFALSFAGCRPDNAQTGPLDTPECNAGAWLGRFNGSATGAVVDTLAGCAYYGVQAGEPLPLFGLVLTDGNPQTATLKIRIWIPGGPAGSQITVGDARGQINGFVLVGNRSFRLSGGSMSMGVVISTDNSTTMRQGSINLAAEELETGDRVSVTGDFLAKGVDQPLIRQH